MERLELLADKQDCTELVFRMARAIDRCDAAMLASLFHPGATDDHGLFSGSADDFVTWVMPMLATMQATHHVIGQVLIELARDHGVGESYFVAHHAIAGPDEAVHMIAAGRYLDRFERRDGVWKITHRQAVYDWSSSAPATDSWNRAATGPMAFGQRGDADASYAHFTSRRAAGVAVAAA